MENQKTTDYKRIYTGVFLVGLVCLMYELIQVRMFSFFLGSISNFLAIPIALLGLALGSIFCHLVYKGSKERLISVMSVLIFPVLTMVFVSFFFIVDTFFAEIHHSLQNPYRDAGKLLTYSALFLPPYFIFGALLSTYFSMASDRIGKLYFFDLVGAGLGCFMTPMLLTFTDLPPVILALLFCALVITLNTTIKHGRVIIAASLVAFCLVQALVFSGTIFKEHPDPMILARTVHRQPNRTVEEIDVQWNELARTSLLRMTPKTGIPGPGQFAVVQDDGLSNIWLVPYRGPINPKQAMTIHPDRGLPYRLGQNPRRIMVMFAGAGRDLVAFEALSGGTAEVTGVEINRAVVQTGKMPITHHLGIHKLLEKKNINLVVREGRDFLNQDKKKYDFIFVANNAAVFASRTGHTRKYLDTYEAMRAYMDHLTKDGMILFYNQPIKEKVPSFRRLFKEQQIPNFEQSIYMYGVRHRRGLNKLVVKPSGFTKAEVAVIDNANRTQWKRNEILYSPSGAGRTPFSTLVKAPLKQLTATMITDDKPFVHQVDWAGFKLFPSRLEISRKLFASSWIKIITIIIFGVASLLIMAVIRFVGGRENRLPLLWILYFLTSGISYMAVEIGLIAKTELFMGNPLYAVAVILAAFLTSNGIGAYAQDRYGVMRGPKTLILLTVASVAWGILTVGICNHYLLSVPMPLKILCVMVAVFPCGACLGMYYPFGVAALVKNGMGNAVPATYGMATLSSVLGSAWAMTIITNLGFSVVIGIGALGYTLTAFVYVAARRFSLK